MHISLSRTLQLKPKNYSYKLETSKYVSSCSIFKHPRLKSPILFNFLSTPFYLFLIGHTPKKKGLIIPNYYSIILDTSMFETRPSAPIIQNISEIANKSPRDDERPIEIIFRSRQKGGIKTKIHRAGRGAKLIFWTNPNGVPRNGTANAGTQKIGGYNYTAATKDERQADTRTQWVRKQNHHPPKKGDVKNPRQTSGLLTDNVHSSENCCSFVGVCVYTKFLARISEQANCCGGWGGGGGVKRQKMAKAPLRRGAISWARGRTHAFYSSLHPNLPPLLCWSPPPDTLYIYGIRSRRRTRSFVFFGRAKCRPPPLEHCPPSCFVNFNNPQT